MNKNILTLQNGFWIVGIVFLIAFFSYCRWDKASTNSEVSVTEVDTLTTDTVTVVSSENGTEKKEVKAISKPVAQEYKEWTKDTKPEPLFTDKQIEEQLNKLSKLKAKEKETKGLELQKDFNNPMESQTVSGKFTDTRKSSYTINEYTRRLAMDEDISVKVVKVTRNDQNRITQLEVEETSAE